MYLMMVELVSYYNFPIHNASKCAIFYEILHYCPTFEKYSACGKMWKRADMLAPYF